MTVQVSDTCTYHGRRWAVEGWDGDCSVIPTNTQLGISTAGVTTANWSGRVDHFTIFREKLYLLKVEVVLTDQSRGLLPVGAQREVLTRYEVFREFSGKGEHEVTREHRFERLVFHDLPVRFTGDLFLSYPYIDLWEQPLEADDDEDDKEELVLTLDDGLVVAVNKLSTRDVTGSGPSV